MPENPYEPPGSAIIDERAQALEGTGTFQIGQCLSDAWDDTWANFPLWLGVLLLGTVLIVASVITVLGLVFILPILVWGFARFYLNMTDGRASFGDLFAGFSNYGQVLVGMIVLLLCLYGLTLVGQAVQLVGQFSDSAELMLIGGVVNLVWVMAVMVRFYFAIFFVVDRNLGPIESLQLSWEVTRGQTLKLVGLLLATIVVAFLGLLVFLVGIIPASVIGYLAWTSAYRQLVGRPAQAHT